MKHEESVECTTKLRLCTQKFPIKYFNFLPRQLSFRDVAEGQDLHYVHTKCEGYFA